jgi:methionine-rich copper-binding protein CopC
MVIKYRMAAAFYIKVPQLHQQGSLESLKVEASKEELTVTPLLKNAGNTVIRPLTSLKVMNAAGVAVLELPQAESLPLLGGSELIQPLVLQARLAPGTYTASFRVDFQDGSRPTEGVTEFTVRESQAVSNATSPGQNPTSNE